MSPKRVPVTVKYANLGAQPPIYLAGSFSDWQPEEMEFTTDSNNEHEFQKTVTVTEGTDYQYKFRIGPGDWWVLNEKASIVTDDLGNRNNSLVVPISVEQRDAPLPTETAPAIMEGDHIKTQPGSHPVRESLKTSADVQDDKVAVSGDSADPVEKTELSVPAVFPNPAEQKMVPSVDPALLTIPETSVHGAEDYQTESSGSEAILTPSTTGEKPELLANEAAEITHGSTQDPPRIPTPVPEVVIEKVDDEPRHGEDLGEKATEGQKEAYEKRALDAEPDLVIIKPEEVIDAQPGANGTDIPNEPMASKVETQDKPTPVEDPGQSQGQTPDEVASEVADSAALVDQEDPEPQLPDEEAGKLGLRRLSSTPIPEVARTASEVADTAALIDVDDKEPEPSLQRKETLPDIAEPVTNDLASEKDIVRPLAIVTPALSDAEDFKVAIPKFEFVDPDSADASGTATPANEKAPLFTHEDPTQHDQETYSNYEPVVEEAPPHRYENEDIVDFNDPTLEVFPSERGAILHTVRSCETRLDADQTNFVGIPSSPVVGKDPREVQDLEEPESVLLATPSRSNLSAHSSPILDVIKEEQPELDTLNSLPSSHSFDQPDITSREIEPPENTAVPIETAEAQKHQQDVVTAPPLAEDSDPVFIPLIGQTSEKSDLFPDKNPEPLVSVQERDHVNETKGKPAKMENEFDQAVTRDLPPSTETAQRDTTNIQTSSIEPLSNSSVGAAAVTIPHAEGFVPTDIDIGTSEDTLSPSSVLPGMFEKSRSTAVEPDRDTDAPQPTMRNLQSVKRAATPSSLSSPHIEAQTRNMFEAIWQIVFVQWIGGFIRRLCGGDRGA